MPTNPSDETLIIIVLSAFFDRTRPAVEEPQRGGHQEHEGRRNQEPGGIGLVHGSAAYQSRP